MIRLGVLGSTNGTDLQAILDAVSEGELDAVVAVVISNRTGAYILERAEINNVSAFFISHKGKKREEFDDEITAVLKEHSVDLVLLIGFMRILSPEFCRVWQDRILNVHPSLLPKYAGGMDINILKALENRKACLMSNHGQITFGVNLKQAFELAEEVENICHQYIITLKIGKPKILSYANMQKILEKIKHYKKA